MPVLMSYTVCCHPRCAFVRALRCHGNVKPLKRSLDAAATPVLDFAGLSETIQPLADVLNILTPMPITKYSHPIVMAAFLVGIGGQATYLGWQLRLSNDPDAIVAAKEAHPRMARLLVGSFTFGAVGGLISLVMQGKPLFQSPHAITGIVGLVLLYLQAMLSLFFEDDPAARSIHAFFGVAVMAFFTLHLKLGVDLALSL